MATLIKTPSGTWKALIRKNGWPTVAVLFTGASHHRPFAS